MDREERNLQQLAVKPILKKPSARRGNSISTGRVRMSQESFPLSRNSICAVSRNSMNNASRNSIGAASNSKSIVSDSSKYTKENIRVSSRKPISRFAAIDGRLTQANGNFKQFHPYIQLPDHVKSRIAYKAKKLNKIEQILNASTA